MEGSVVDEREREEAERLHRRAVAAEARAAARQLAKERGIEEEIRREKEKPRFIPKSQRGQIVAEATVSNAPPKRRKNQFSASSVPTLARVDNARSSREPAEKQPREPSSSGVNNAELADRKRKKGATKPSEKFARIFQFDWDADEDTSVDSNPLYAKKHAVQPLMGRGYVAGVDMREQRKAHDFVKVLAAKREEEEEDLDEERRLERRRERERVEAELDSRAEKSGLGREASHWSEKRLEDMTERDWRIFKEDFDIRVGGGRAPRPLRFWKEAGLRDELLATVVDDLGFEEPSPIQRQAIPVSLEQRDVIGVAETGSGKTAAFAIPLIQWVLGLPRERIALLADQGPLGLVLAPTRELASQIHEEIVKLSSRTQIKSCTVVGGASIEDQAFRLREGVELIVGTPGRINDCLDTQYLVLNQANYVVLDECDRMLDMGFEPQVTQILEAMGGLLKSENENELARQEESAKIGAACYRITSMFSATMPPGVENLAKRFMRLPAIVSIGDDDTNKNKRITQTILFVQESSKKKNLVDLLQRKKSEDKYLVFCNEKKTCDLVGKFLLSTGLRVGILHGGKSQESREYSLDQFKQGIVTTLVATDVAGRGLDVPDVAVVVNYDMPLKIENYSHRIGRTGRAGKFGQAITLLTDSDEAIMYELRQYLEQTDAEIPTALERHPAANAKPGERNERGELLTVKAAKGKTEFLRDDIFSSSTRR